MLLLLWNRGIAGHVVDTNKIQLPINCVLAGQQQINDRGIEYDIKPPSIKQRTRVSAGASGRLSGPAPSFTVTTNKRGYS